MPASSRPVMLLNFKSCFFINQCQPRSQVDPWTLLKITCRQPVVYCSDLCSWLGQTPNFPPPSLAVSVPSTLLSSDLLPMLSLRLFSSFQNADYSRARIFISLQLFIDCQAMCHSLFLISIPHCNSTRGVLLAPFYRCVWWSHLPGVSAGVWWNLGSELLGPPSRPMLYSLFQIVDPTSVFTCCEKPLSPQRWGSQRGWKWWKKPHWSPVGPSQGAFGGVRVSWACSQPQGQRPRTGKKSELNSDIKKEAVRTEWSLWACILNVFSLCKKKKTAKVMFLHKGSLCFIAILIYGPYIPVIVLNWIAK